MTMSDKDLTTIRSKLAVMGKLASSMFNDASLALAKSDRELSREVIAKDSQVDSLENEIEGLCLTFLALKAPKALELRFAVAVTRLTNEIERIADHATVMCRENLARHLGPFWAKAPEFGRMTAMAGSMVTRAMDCFFASDDMAYQGLLEDDKKVGELQQKLNAWLIDMMAKDADKGLDIVSLLNILRRIERVADHAKNIGVMVPYVTKGILLRHNRGDGQDADNGE
ncbi:MAG: phosphate signaling complex protein PhoU [Deltaproteobacteria bacterium]|jgi:phosphate transport system protein|nr:phosphate signaling complex protein PhoU [Deltaproteobacteria bacterium]